MFPLVLSGLLILAVAGCALALWARVSMYRKLFAKEHFFQVGEGIDALKQAALSNIDIDVPQAARSPSDDPRWFRTDAGLALFYTITKQSSGKYLHHASVSLSGTYTAHGVGERFILLW